MDKHNILQMVIPSNEPSTMYKYFLPSLKNMSGIAQITNICFNFQDPYTDDQVRDIVSQAEDLGFKVYYQLRDKYNIPSKGYVPFNAIRNDAHKLNPNSLIYVLTDDDFSYGLETSNNPSSLIQYLRAIYYMLKYWDRCGIILAGGSMYKYNPKNTIGLTKTWTGEQDIYMTGHSLFLRSMRDIAGYELFPDDALGLYGAKEESVLCSNRINEGMFPAKYGNSRVRHFENHNKEVKSGDEDYGWLKEEILDQNANKYMNEKFGVSIKGLPNIGGVARPEVYYGKGGPDHEKDRDKFFEDFREGTEMSTWTVEDYLEVIYSYFENISEKWDALK